MTYITDPDSWLVVGVTLALVLACILLHYEVLRACINYLPLLSERRRRRVLFLILAIVTTHVAEIWLFALGYFGLVRFASIGELTGVASAELADYVYYSAMVYTTVGFGDIAPSGQIRFMTGMEALVGLVMITWSASFTFLEMQRDWAGRGRRS